MASPFPISPENGDTYTAFGRTYEYSSLKSAWHPVSIAPKTSEIIGVEQFETPDVGDILVSDGTLFTKSTPNLPKIYLTIAELPLSGNIVGNIAVVSENNRVYIWNGAGWFSVALINTSPTITVGPNATYELNDDGTPTVITLAAVDPEEVPITWTYSVASGSLEDTTVTNDGPEFTIAPGTVSTTFSLNFVASDGINYATQASAFTLTFILDLTQVAKVQATDKLANANIAYGSIDIAQNANYIVCGSPYIRNGSTITGGAYVFYNSGTGWAQQKKMIASDAAAPDGAGFAVAMDSTGTYVLVGAYQETTSPTSYQGAVYAWSRSGTSWIQNQKILPPSAANSDAFGSALAMDGAYAITSAPSRSVGGYAFIYTRSGTTWSLQATLVHSDPVIVDFFGADVSISGDTVVVGAYNKVNSGLNQVGAAYIFTRSGSTWTQQAKLLPSTIQTSAAFGRQVVISGDTIAVYASGQSKLYIYKRSGTVWTESQIIDVTAGGSLQRNSIDLNGNVLVVGDQGSAEYANLGGVVYKYVRNDSSSDFILVAKAHSEDVQAIDRLGCSVAANATTIAAGATLQNSDYDSGAVYVFNL